MNRRLVSLLQFVFVVSVFWLGLTVFLRLPAAHQPGDEEDQLAALQGRVHRHHDPPLLHPLWHPSERRVTNKSSAEDPLTFSRLTPKVIPLTQTLRAQAVTTLPLNNGGFLQRLGGGAADLGNRLNPWGGAAKGEGLGGEGAAGEKGGEVMERLIKEGLVIKRWTDEREASVNPKQIGEFGAAVKVVRASLTGEERRLLDAGWTENEYNTFVSDRVSLHRALEDPRVPECRAVQRPSKLPDTSVIVVFYNEGWSALLRTVHSILDRSPPHLLKEVILVDDFSNRDHLKQQLDAYMARLVKVKVLRAKRREGLIRARLLGASQASGRVLTFLDSHCECTKGWLEPLLARIGENRTTVIAPVIESIDADTFLYTSTPPAAIQVGVFNWNLIYNWKPPPPDPARRPHEPLRTPTHAGGLFSIDKSYFLEIGAYDPGMEIWGSENLELSFRVWMCGGRLEIHPCSHVGHIFRKKSPYLSKSPNASAALRRNAVRLAEVWLDEYKHLYYDRIQNQLGDFGDVTGRKELRKQLKCETFSWYLKNVIPGLFIPSEALMSGEFRSKALLDWKGAKNQRLCLDAKDSDLNKPVALWPCHGQGGNQYWIMSKTGELRRDDACLDYGAGRLVMLNCHTMRGNQEWIYDSIKLQHTECMKESLAVLLLQSKRLVHRPTGLCVEVDQQGTLLAMKPCQRDLDRQVWENSKTKIR